MDSMNENLGKIALRARKRLGLSQEEVAEAVGMTQSNVSEFENGKGHISQRLFEKLLDVLCIRLYIEGERNESEPDIKELNDIIRVIPPKETKVLLNMAKSLINYSDSSPKQEK